jgi:signal transduction histidine kinase
MRQSLEILARAPATGYVAAVVIPIAIMLGVTWLGLPAFMFEHLVILLVVAFAVLWGLGAASTAAVVAVAAYNLSLRQFVGQSPITGLRDAVDLLLFVIVAVVVSGLVAKARSERARAEAAAERERRAREDLDRLIATVSHDLATPLAVLSGTLQFARRAGTQADLPRLLARLETATGRATSLVRTLADARALDADSLALNSQLLDLRDLVTTTAQMVDRLSDRHPVVLAVPETPVIVRVDEERLQRVLENLVNNAIKYSPDGGAVEVSLSVEGDHAHIQVRDYGIGISRDALSRVFDRSYRAPEAAAVAPGLGLGLNIASQIVARHGGAMDMRPADGRGTIVSVRIPLARAISGAPETAVTPQTSRSFHS